MGAVGELMDALILSYRQHRQHNNAAKVCRERWTLDAHPAHHGCCFPSSAARRVCCLDSGMRSWKCGWGEAYLLIYFL